MNLVNELQISAEDDDVLTVLRKTKRLASKLDRQDIMEWLQHEQNGYEGECDLPGYRMIGSIVAYNTNGYVPAGFGMMKKGIVDLTDFGTFETPFRESISAVQAMVDELKAGKRQGVYYSIPPSIDSGIRSHLQIHPDYARQLSLLMHLNKTQITAIPEQIKDRVLDWACALERAGIKGEGMSFRPEEISSARLITFNISNCHIEQLNNMGNNQRS